MRAKSVVYTRQRKKKVFRRTKGYYSNRNNRWRQAIQQLEKSLRHAYVGRIRKKQDYRSLWITRLSAACKLNNISYSRFISGLKKSNIMINRKMLSELAIHDSALFAKIVEQSRAS